MAYTQKVTKRSITNNINTNSFGISNKGRSNNKNRGGRSSGSGGKGGRGSSSARNNSNSFTKPLTKEEINNIFYKGIYFNYKE